MKDDVSEEIEEAQAPKWTQTAVPGRHIDGGIQGVRLWDEPKRVSPPRRSPARRITP